MTTPPSQNVTPPPTGTTGIVQPDSSTAPAAASANQVKPLNTLTTLSKLPSSMDALQREYPELYNLLTQSIFINFMQQNNRFQEHIKDINSNQFADQYSS